jgi:photosystem II PsbY protein
VLAGARTLASAEAAAAVLVVPSKRPNTDTQVGKVAALSAVASTWMVSGQAQAAVELANVAAGDNRLSTISLLFLPALGWVAFNIVQPALNQLNRQNEIREEATAGGGGGRRKRGLAGAVGLGAALSVFAAQQADAATELAQLAGSDNRYVCVCVSCVLRDAAPPSLVSCGCTGMR